MAHTDVSLFLNLCIASFVGNYIGNYIGTLIGNWLFPRDDRPLTKEEIQEHYEVMKRSTSEILSLIEEAKLRTRELQALKEQKTES